MPSVTPPFDMPATTAVPCIENATAFGLAVLESITAANGYPFDLVATRSRRDDEPPDDLRAYLTALDARRVDLAGSGERGPEQPLAATGRPGEQVGVQQIRQRWQVEVFRRLPKGDPRPIDQVLEQLSAWIQLAWLADPTLGGTVETSWWAGHDLFHRNDPPGVAVFFDALLWTDAANPLDAPVLIT